MFAATNENTKAAQTNALDDSTPANNSPTLMADLGGTVRNTW